MQTIRYKTGYIHLSYRDGKEYVYCAINPYAYTMRVKSVRAAKLRISKARK
jgi:hypothetical protein